MYFKKAIFLHHFIDKSEKFIKSKNQLVHVLCEDIQKNLEMILNTKRYIHSWQDNYRELEKSVVNYGIDDFTSISLESDVACEKLCQDLEKTIAFFEPRLTKTKVNLEQKISVFKQKLNLRISALIYLDPEYEPVIFNSVLEKNKRQFLMTYKLD